MNLEYISNLKNYINTIKKNNDWPDKTITATTTFEELLDIYQLALKLNMIQKLKDIGNNYYRFNRIDDAISTFKLFIDNSADDDVYERMILFLLKKGDWKNYVKYVSRYFKKTKNKNNALKYIALYHIFQSKNYEQAKIAVFYGLNDQIVNCCVNISMLYNRLSDNMIKVVYFEYIENNQYMMYKVCKNLVINRLGSCFENLFYLYYKMAVYCQFYSKNYYKMIN